jgi:hypothetical protein
MKGKMTQPQIVLAAAGGGFMLIMAVAGYFGWSSLGDLQLQAQALAERKVKPELAAILTKPGGASAARKEAVEIRKLTDEVTQVEESLVGSWREGYEKASGVGQAWSQDPNQWKDRLIAANDRLKKLSGKKGDISRVVFADDFYLGLQEYKQQNPPADKVPELALQLSVAEKLVELLMETKKATKEKYPTKCIILSNPTQYNTQSSSSHGVSATDPDKKSTENAKPGISQTGVLRQGYTFEFEGSPEVFYGFIQRIAKDPWLFIVMNLSLENDLKEFPKRSEIAKKFADGNKSADSATIGNSADGARGGANALTRPPLLMVLAGKEMMKVVVQIDFVGWRTPVAGRPAEKGKM